MTTRLCAWLPALFAIDALLVGAHFTLGSSFPFFDLDREHNLPTWYASLQLALAGLAALELATLERRQDPRPYPDARFWSVLGAAFLFLSLDEMAVIHEGLLKQEVRNAWSGGSLWLSIMPWLLVLGPPLGLVAVMMLALLWTRRAGAMRPGPLGTAGLTCLAGAVFCEALAIPLVGASGSYHVEAGLEEALELLGVTLIVAALAGYGAALERGEPLVGLERAHALPRLARAAAAVSLVVALGASVVIAATEARAAWIHRFNGGWLVKEGRTVDAVTAYRAALALDPKDAASMRGMARAYRRIGNRASADAWDQRALETESQR